MIQLITSEQTWDLRHRVLRPHQTAYQGNPQDKNPSSFHVGFLQNEKIVGIASFHEEPFAELKASKPYRLRGMATDPLAQKQNIGKQVLEFSFQHLQSLNCDLLWCNAREKAFPFYEKMGFLYLGPLFDIEGIGPHKVMYKYLLQG